MDWYKSKCVRNAFRPINLFARCVTTTTSTRHPQPKLPYQFKSPNCIQRIKQNYDNLNYGAGGLPSMIFCLYEHLNLQFPCVRNFVLSDAYINVVKQTLFFMSPQRFCATPAKLPCLTRNHCLGDRNHFLEVLQRFVG